MDLSARQVINYTASWFLGFYEPAQWSKVIEHLEANINAATVKTEQGTMSVSRDAIGQLKALVAEAQAGAAPEAHSEEPA